MAMGSMRRKMWAKRYPNCVANTLFQTMRWATDRASCHALEQDAALACEFEEVHTGGYNCLQDSWHMTFSMSTGSQHDGAELESKNLTNNQLHPA